MRETLTRDFIDKNNIVINNEIEIQHYDKLYNQVVTIKTYQVIKVTKKGTFKPLKISIWRNKKGSKKLYCGYHIGKNVYSAGKLFYAYFRGEVPANMDIDHIDNDSLNNRIFNLQLLSHYDNCKKKHLDDPTLIERERAQCRYASMCRLKAKLDCCLNEEEAVALMKKLV